MTLRSYTSITMLYYFIGKTFGMEFNPHYQSLLFRKNNLKIYTFEMKFNPHFKRVQEIRLIANESCESSNPIIVFIE